MVAICLCPIPMPMLLLLLALLAISTPLVRTVSSPNLFMDRHGCGETKGCLFKPVGCNPMLDCSISIMFFVSGRNKLTVQMAAQSLVPSPPLQYVAIGYSPDMFMGEDFVTECVLSPDASAFNDIEVFASYNLDRTSNDRSQLNMSEHSLLYENVKGEIVDGRLYCSFEQSIRPQFSLSNGPADRIWDLDKKYWIMGATGSAQPDEINAHDTAMGSHFYPIVSSRAIDPSRIGVRYYELPPPFAAAMKMPQSPSPRTSMKIKCQNRSQGLQPGIGQRQQLEMMRPAISWPKGPFSSFLLHSIIVPLLACAFYWN